MPKDRNSDIYFEQRIDFPYWDGLAKGEIKLQRCSACQQWRWPAEWRCGECGSWDYHWESVIGEGLIYAWERTHYPFSPDFEPLLPYVNVLVELPQAGRSRLIGVLLEPNEGVKIGAKVRAEILPANTRTRNLPALWWRLADTATGAQ